MHKTESVNAYLYIATILLLSSKCMYISFIATTAASEKPAAKIFVTKNPTRKVYEILCSDLKPYDIVHVIDSSKSVGASGHIYAKSAAQVTLFIVQGL